MTNVQILIAVLIAFGVYVYWAYWYEKRNPDYVVTYVIQLSKHKISIQFDTPEEVLAWLSTLNLHAISQLKIKHGDEYVTTTMINVKV